jgi:hypothetical protein
MLPHVALDALLVIVSPRAVSIALAVVRRFNGYNNGRISMSMRDLAEAIGSANHAANIAALRELEHTGFLAVTRYPKGQRKANDYRLTFVSSGPNGEQPATHDYLDRLETGLETEKFTVAATATRNTLRVVDIETRKKHRVSDIETGATETCGFHDPSPVVDIATHIDNHPGVLSGSDGNCPSDAPKSRAVVSSAAMDERELRVFATSFLAKAEPGSQSRLAHEAGIPGGTFSKFLRGRSLPEQYRMPLQLAVGRSYPLEARNADAA